jgi:hypothetical protein
LRHVASAAAAPRRALERDSLGLNRVLSSVRPRESGDPAREAHARKPGCPPEPVLGPGRRPDPSAGTNGEGYFNLRGLEPGIRSHIPTCHPNASSQCVIAMLRRPGGTSGARAAPCGSSPRATTRGMERRAAHLTARHGRLVCTTIACATVAGMNLAAWGVPRPLAKDARPSALHCGICGEGQTSASAAGPRFRNRQHAGRGFASSSRGGRSTARAESGAAREPCVRGTARGKPLQTEASRLRPSAGVGGQNLRPKGRISGPNHPPIRSASRRL